MIITNKYNLPQVIVDFAKDDGYSAGKSNISVTTLLNSPRIVQLQKKHWNEIESDVAKRFFMILGTAVHYMMEKNAPKNVISEERIHTHFNGWDISGAIDSQQVEEDGVILSDYKTTSAWAAMNDKPDWEQQLNLYAWLVEREKKLPVKKLQIIAVIRDWKQRDVGKEGYPPAPMVVIDIKMWTSEEREAFMSERLNEHAEADTSAMLGSLIQKCTPAEQWRTNDTFAVMKKAGVRALRVFDTRDEADKFAAETSNVVVARPGYARRCHEYCDVSKFCQQFKEENEIL